jgi:membrane associated rhomboid family serine protease
LRDVNPTRSTAWVTHSLLAANLGVFAVQVLGPVPAEQLVFSFGFIPARLVSGDGSSFAGPSPFVTLFTSMFLHGDVLHLAGNALYLWIFGNNVEDVLGHFRYIVLYAFSGLAGHALHTIAGPGLEVPTIGASGAISGVLAAYLLRFPHARVHSLIFFGFFVRTAIVPASVLILVWFVMQLLSGFISLGVVAPGGGIAWFEHIGGFAGGLVSFVLLGGRRRS